MRACKWCHEELRASFNGRPRDYCDEKCKKRAYHKRHPRPDPKPRTILGIDSETGRSENGPAPLILIACSDGTHIAGDDISSDEALQYIVERDGELWSFVTRYDVTYWLKNFPFSTLDRLRTTNWCRWKQWHIHHVPGKFWCKNRSTGQSATIWDAWRFYPTSFVTWLQDWKILPAETIEWIAKNKSERRTFRVTTPEILKYTQDEVDGIARGVVQLKERIHSVGARPAQWYSAGSVAAWYLREYGVERYMLRSPKLAARAFFGGRTETSVVGRYPWRVHRYDINSAYPAAALTLPCLKHGEWSRRSALDPESLRALPPSSLVHVSWVPEGGRILVKHLTGKKKRRLPTWGPFPVHPAYPNKGSLRYYAEGSGWYWLEEILPWIGSPRYSINVHGALVWTPACEHRPFAWMQDLYDRRRKMKAQNDPGEYAIKIALNSCYGKLAQRVGKARFHSLVWAGMITARTRAELSKVLVQHDDSILVVATDGVISKNRLLDLPLDEVKLGSWNYEGHSRWVDVWQPGMYFLPEGVKSRGFTPREVSLADFRKAWDFLCIAGRVKAVRDRPIGYRLATHRNRPDQLGAWVRDEAALSFDPRPRRSADSTRLHATNAGLLLPTQAPPSERWERRRGDPEKDAEAFIAVRRAIDYVDDGLELGFDRG